ncbi:MAG TPA: hypothetical protein VLV86_17015 [Vicinamibacterales bacterium]|nr:hypothetical protein [Vicinamibacterales bacterium]
MAAWSKPGRGRQGNGGIALNASDEAQPLYASLGYQVAPSPMMWKIT